MALLETGAAILPPSDDRVFKLLLTHPDAKPVLMDIISAVLNCKVLDAQVRNNEVPPTDMDEKMERFDVNTVIDGGKQVDLEMQASSIEEKVLDEHISLKRKTIYYLCDLHSSQSSKGKAYNKLVQTYQVTFCSYTVFPQRPAFLNKFSMRAEDGFLFSDDIQAIFIELSKIDKILEKSVNELSPIEMWSIFLRYANIPEFRNNVNEVIKAREVMSVATELLTSISQDEKERAIFRSRRMFQSDLESNILTAEERGEERGEARGIAIGETRGIAIGEAKYKASINKIAQDMKKNNISIALIASITGLSAEAIEKL